MNRSLVFAHLFAGLALVGVSGWILAGEYAAKATATGSTEGALIGVAGLAALVLIASWTQFLLALPQVGAALLALKQHRWSSRALAAVAVVQLCVYLPFLWLLIEERVVLWMLVLVPLIALDFATLIAVARRHRSPR